MPAARALATLVILASACVTPRPVPRNEPPTTFTFAPPPGGAVAERWLQRRAITVLVDGREPATVVELHSGAAEERYDKQADGTFIVTAKMTEQGALRDGQPMLRTLSLVDVPVSQHIGADGAYLGAVDVLRTLGMLRERLFGSEARLAFDAQVTPQGFETSQQASWEGRLRHACNRAIAPGDVRFDLDVQEFPTGAPVQSLVRRTAIGTVPDWPPALGPAPFRFFLEFTGLDSAIARTPEAAAYLRTLTPETRAGFTATVDGTGEQLVDPSTCQVVHELVKLEGRRDLDRQAAAAAGVAGLARRYDFRADRELSRGVPGAVPPPAAP